MAEVLNYQANSFEGIVPVLDVGDPSASLLESFKGQVEDLTTNLTRMEKDAIIEQRNLKTQQKGFQDIMKFSATAFNKYGEFRREQTKQEAAEEFAKVINSPDDPSKSEAAVKYREIEKEVNDTKTKVDEAVAQGLKKQEKTEEGSTAQTMATATLVQERTGGGGLMDRVRANARAYKAAQSFEVGMRAYIKKAQDQHLKDTGKLLTPAQVSLLKYDYEVKWGKQTGLANANAGFLANNVIPGIRKTAQQHQLEYTKVHSIWDSSQRKQVLDSQLYSGEIGLKEWHNGIGTTTKNGISPVTPAEGWADFLNLRLDKGQLQKIRDKNQINPITGKPYHEHPQFAKAEVIARRDAKAEWDMDMHDFNVQSMEGFAAADQDVASINREDERQALAGIPDWIRQRNRSAALGRTVQHIQNQEDEAKLEELLLTQETLSAADVSGMSVLTINKFAKYLDASAKGEGVMSSIKNDPWFKELDTGDLVQQIDKNIQLRNDAEGITGPANQRTWEVMTKEDIARDAYGILLDPNFTGTTEQALQQARNNWVERQRRLHAEGKFYNPQQGFLQDAIVPNPNTDAGIRASVTQLNNTKWSDLNKTLTPSDLTGSGPTARTEYLGRQFGKRWDEIVNEARRQAGMEPLQATANQKALATADPESLARIQSLKYNSLQSLQRLDIQSGGVLRGNPSERAFATMQWLWAAHVGGIWQNNVADYDKGQIAGGGENSGHVVGSDHYKTDPGTTANRVFDIGQQANTPEEMENTYVWLKKNKKRLGITQLFYDPNNVGRDGSPPNHDAHIHVGFG